MTEGRKADQEATEYRLQTQLTLLYGSDAAARLSASLLETGRRRLQAQRLAGPPRIGPLDQRDALLVSYGGSIRRPGEAPLQTLQTFADGPLAGLFSALHVLPFFPSSSDDGFSVVDYYAVDPELGDWPHVATLAAARDLMVDLVINHCSRENLWFLDFLSGREPGCHYFIEVDAGWDVTRVVRPRTSPLVTDVLTYQGHRSVWTTFSEDQVDLNFRNPQVLVRMVDVLFFYISRGARYIRLDAVGFLWKNPGTACLHEPETHALVKVLRALVDRLAPGVLLVSETNVPHEENVGYFGEGDEAHLVYQFSLAPLLLHAHVFGTSRYLQCWARSLQPPPPGCTFLNFMASHDGIGLRPLENLVPEDAVAALVDRMRERGGHVLLRDTGNGGEAPYEINITLFSAFGGMQDNVQSYLGAHALMLAFDGVPALYIHSALASTNDYHAVEQTGRTRSINRGMLDAQTLGQALADPGSLRRQVLDGLRHLMDIRRQLPAFAPGMPQSVVTTEESLFAMRRGAGAAQVLVVASLVDRPLVVTLSELGVEDEASLLDHLSGQTLVGPELRLGPHQVVWLQASAW